MGRRCPPLRRACRCKARVEATGAQKPCRHILTDTASVYVRVVRIWVRLVLGKKVVWRLIDGSSMPLALISSI